MATEMGTIMHTDGRIERRAFPCGSNTRARLNALYAAIGGGCRCVAAPSITVAGRALAMYCDDDGLANQQPNLIATLFYGAPIVGAVVIFGETMLRCLTALGYEISETAHEDAA